MSEIYRIREKFCPTRQKNVIVRVTHPGGHEECTERHLCEKCTNAYLQSADSDSHSP